MQHTCQKCPRKWTEIFKGGDHLEKLSAVGRILLKYNFEKQGVRIRIGFIWLKINSVAGC